MLFAMADTNALSLAHARELKVILKTIPKFITEALEKLEKQHSLNTMTLVQLFDRMVRFPNKPIDPFPLFEFRAEGPVEAIRRELALHGFVVVAWPVNSSRSYSILLQETVNKSKLTTEPMLPLYSDVVSAKNVNRINQVHAEGARMTIDACNRRLYQLRDEIKAMIIERFNIKPDFIFEYTKRATLLFSIGAELKWLISCTTGEDLCSMITEILTKRGLTVQMVTVANAVGINFCYVRTNLQADKTYTYPLFTGNKLSDRTITHLKTCVAEIRNYVGSQTSPSLATILGISQTLNSMLASIKMNSTLELEEPWYCLLLDMHGYWESPARWGSRYHLNHVPTNPIIPTTTFTQPTLQFDKEPEPVNEPVKAPEKEKAAPSTLTIPTSGTIGATMLTNKHAAQTVSLRNAIYQQNDKECSTPNQAINKFNHPLVKQLIAEMEKRTNYDPKEPVLDRLKKYVTQCLTLDERTKYLALIHQEQRELLEKQSAKTKEKTVDKPVQVPIEVLDNDPFAESGDDGEDDDDEDSEHRLNIVAENKAVSSRKRTVDVVSREIDNMSKRSRV
jgi:hypothetical protein